MLSRLLPAARRDEQGSFAPMTALLLVVLVGFTAFAVDLGLQRAAARDMQAVADVVALDTARSLPNCNDATLTSVANRSFDRQTSDPIGATDDLEAEAGHIDRSTGAFVAGAGSGGCDAVRISARTEVGYAFAPVLGTDSGSATRTAVGTRANSAVCFAAGTKALTLNTSKTALGPLLDRILRVNLDVASFAGLVDLQKLYVPIAEIAADLGAGTAQELVDTDVTLGRFMLATANVLRDQGRVAQAEVLESVAAQVDDLTLTVGDFLALDTTGSSGLDASVDALDLIGSAIVEAAIANGQNAVALGADLGLPLNLLNANARMVLIEPPQIACGPVGTVAKTAQVRVDLRTGLSALGAASVDLDLGVQVASGTAELTAIACGRPRTTQVRGLTSVATISGYGGTGRARVHGRLLLLPLFDVNLNGSVGQREASHIFNFPPAPDFVQIYGGGERIILRAETGGLLGVLLNPVLDLVNQLTAPVDDILRPLLQLLGIKLGIMEVSMLGEPACDAVRLSG